jgi:hypothetical protein
MMECGVRARSQLALLFLYRKSLSQVKEHARIKGLSLVTLLPKLQSNANHNPHNFRKVDSLEQEFMLKGEDFDETPAENLMAFSRKNCEQFAGYTNDGTGDDSKTNAILHSKTRKYEQVRKHDGSGSE